MKQFNDFDDIKVVVHSYGKDETDSLLKNQISRLSRTIKQYRLRLMDLKETLANQTNTDEIRHIQYEIQEYQESVKDHLKRLEKVNGLYIDFIQLH